MTPNNIAPNSEPEDGSVTAAPHPEEMKATVDVTIGKSASIKATARVTPAGLVAAALLVTALLMPWVLLARTRAREPLRS